MEKSQPENDGKVLVPASKTAQKIWVKEAKKVYPKLDEFMLELIWDYDQQMRMKHGDNYVAEEVFKAQPSFGEELKFYEGPPREIIDTPAILPYIEENAECEIDEEETECDDEDAVDVVESLIEHLEL